MRRMGIVTVHRGLSRFRGTWGDLPNRPAYEAANTGLSPLHTAEKTARAADL